MYNLKCDLKSKLMSITPTALVNVQPITILVLQHSGNTHLGNHLVL